MKSVLLLSVLMILLCTVGNAKDIELEPRAGVSYTTSIWGIHAGALMSLQLSDKFYFQPGFLINTVSEFFYKANGWKLGLDIPLYASFRVPVSNAAKLRFNAGPFVGISSESVWERRLKLVLNTANIILELLGFRTSLIKILLV